MNEDNTGLRPEHECTGQELANLCNAIIDYAEHHYQYHNDKSGESVIDNVRVILEGQLFEQPPFMASLVFELKRRGYK